MLLKEQTEQGLVAMERETAKGYVKVLEPGRAKPSRKADGAASSTGT